MTAETAQPPLWQRLSPQKRQWLFFGLGAVALVVLAFVIDPSKRPATATGPTAGPKIENLLGTKTDGQELNLRGVASDLTSAETRQQAAEQRIAELESRLKTLSEQTPAPTAVSEAQLQQLRDQLKTAQATLPPTAAAVAGQVPVPGKLQFRTFEAAASAPAGDATGSGPGATPPTPSSTSSASANSIYLPAGTLITGVLITGLDAPTGRGATSQPVPALVRIKQESLLPSRQRVDLREAFVLAAGYGDLASERTYIRSERFSMVVGDGQVIDIPIEMSAVGSDGRAGLRSRLVSKQGRAMRRAALAGLADGVSRALQQGYSYQQAGANGISDPGATGAAVLGSAGSSALDRISQFYMNLADQTYPVLETPAGREVTFVLLKGVSLPFGGVAQTPP